MSIEVPPVSELGPVAPPEPDFAVLGARPTRHAAVPTLLLDIQVSEPRGHRIYMIALTVQLMIEPARRTYDDETRERLLEMFGSPERWAVTTRSLVFAQLQVLVPAFTGSVVVPVSLPCSGDLELAATKYLHALPDGNVPLAAHFNGTIYYPREDGVLQMVLVHWNKSVDAHLPVAVWRETLEHYYPNTGWLSVNSRTLHALRREKLRRGLATLDECVATLLEESGRG
jgi:hypothetical protein